MPSTLVFVQSGGIGIVSGNIYSGGPFDPTSYGRGNAGGIQLKLAAGAPGIIYVGLPNLSGTVNTFLSGGSLTSGGLADAFELSPGDAFFIPKVRLVSGLETPRLLAAAASSGARLFWEIL